LFSPWSAAVRTNPIEFANSELVPVSWKKNCAGWLGIVGGRILSGTLRPL